MNVTIGTKKEMTQLFDKSGRVIPCTIVDVSNVRVVGKRTREKNGYNALILGKDELNEKKAGKSYKYLYKESKFLPKKVVEFRSSDELKEENGTEIKAEIFEEGDFVSVIGISKGKGFAGVVKRYKMKGGPKTHGQSNKHRSIGSIASGQTFAHVYKGRRMAGKMGNDRITVKNLKIVKVDKEKGLICILGGLPGARNSYVYIKKTVK